MSLDPLREAVNRGAMAFHYHCCGIWDGEPSPPPFPGGLAVQCLKSHTLTEFTAGQLQEFADFVRARPETTFINWSGGKRGFGFIPIAARMKEWGMTPVKPERQLDLHGVLVDHFGPGVANHPRFYDLVALNEIPAGARLLPPDDLRREWSSDDPEKQRHVVAWVECMHWIIGKTLDGSLKTRAPAPEKPANEPPSKLRNRRRRNDAGADRAAMRQVVADMGKAAGAKAILKRARANGLRIGEQAGLKMIREIRGTKKKAHKKG